MVTTLKTVVAIVLIAGVWWSMGALALSFDTIQSGVRSMNTPPPAAEEWLIMVDHHESLCCRDFITALALSLWLTSFSAIPMCLIAIGLRWRNRPKRHTSNSQAVIRAAMFFQGAAVATNLLLAYGLVSYAGDLVLDPIILILVGQALVSLIAIPQWFRLAQIAWPQDLSV